jgi:hemerythrin-like domain-containing protein
MRGVAGCTNFKETTSRRRFLLGAGVGAGTVVLALGRGQAKPPTKPREDEDVSPTEDLMREHGVLRRLLLVYDDTIRRLDGNQTVKVELVAQSAQIIRAFIDDYHEKDEEDFIFPRFKKAGKMTDLVDVLLQQHQAGRKLTAEIQRMATASALGNPSNRKQLAQTMRLFIRMYEPHAAREDTVLFPAFAALIGEKEMKELQDVFEQKEKALPLGDFEKMVADVAKIEQALDIYDLARFTPKP